jgi:predicted helicase
MSELQNLLTEYRRTSLTEREKGNYFEELIRTYFRLEATYADPWATETMGNAKYLLEVLLRVITARLETNKIVKELPKLEID